MATSTERTDQLGELFESVTGQSTITEPQHDDHTIRLGEQTEATVSAYVTAVTRADGLDDAVQAPERY
ncbi:hypothetical protein [Halorussus halophilus]|uniref:hypothetical protein n=1 Tax=Halorussus halophilus TaxID=2650975 RepID=UPI001300ED2A|nr:hypothetical protein [Halorussus halophilus]